MKLNSIKFEIGILYTLVLGAILIIFGTVLFITFRTINRELNNTLIIKAKEVDRTIRAYLDVLGAEPNTLSTAAQKTVLLQGENPFKFKSKQVSQQWLKRSNELKLKEDYIHFALSDGTSIARSSNLSDDLLPFFLKDLRITKDKEAAFRKIVYKKNKVQVINYPFFYNDGKEYVIQVGIQEGPFNQLMRQWLYSMMICIPIVLLLTSFLGQFFVGRILEPVDAIIGMAKKITHQDLSLRIETKNFDEEMENLVGAFNDMITRLEGAFRHIEDFSAHAAHELKTPLTIIKGEAEFALRKERHSKEYQYSMRIIMEESERMLKTIADLLLLAKLEYQPGILKFETIDYKNFLGEVCEQGRALAEKKSIRINLSVPPESIKIPADQLHLRRLFFNLIDNAIKFTPSGGQISFKVRLNDKKIWTEISDTGVGISEENLAKIFEKFYRINNQGPGAGLGLNISQSIARMHDGRIQVESKLDRGTTFKIVLPAAEVRKK